MPSNPLDLLLDHADDLAKLLWDEVRGIFEYPPNFSSEEPPSFERRVQEQALTITLWIRQTYIHSQTDFERYKNALHTTYPAVKGKVFAVDYLAIEAWHLFDPNIYDYIELKYPWGGRFPPVYLTPWGWHKAWTTFWEGLWQKLPDDRANVVGGIILSVFPPKVENLKACISNKRALAPPHFKTYFPQSIERREG